MMAHSCPTCGQACYCGGDIDDAFDVDMDAEENCTHDCDPNDIDEGGNDYDDPEGILRRDRDAEADAAVRRN